MVDAEPENKSHEANDDQGRQKDGQGKQGEVKAFLLGDHLKVSSLSASFFVLEIDLFIGLFEEFLEILLERGVRVFLL